jgi:hypothetical protein
VFFLLLALANFPCEIVQDLNPDSPTYDMVDWLTLDADLRATSHLESEPIADPKNYVQFTIVTQDSITYLKTHNGDTWDKALYDDLNVWSFRTETHWGTPENFTQWQTIGQVLSAPRFAHAGFPGMRWVNCISYYGSHNACQLPTHYGGLGNIIHELWGPYDYQPNWGDVKGPILKLVYYYGCSSSVPESCGVAEVTWLHQKYGAFSWREYQRINGEWVLTQAPPITAYVLPGTIAPYFPCDNEIK